MDRIGERLLYLRKERKLSQSEFAKLIHVARPTIAMWEAGTKQPSRSSLEKMSDVFDISLDWLMGKIDTVESITKAEQNLINDAHLPIIELLEKYDFGDVTEEELKEAIEYIKFRRSQIKR